QPTRREENNGAQALQLALVSRFAIAQHHHHVYPVMSGDSDDDEFSLEESNRRLKEAWQS
ncbi:hypothetical protein DER46DRAFT_469986, partial [Fusarium sp. MPI-SDFR-AT-0072]